MRNSTASISFAAALRLLTLTLLLASSCFAASNGTASKHPALQTVLERVALNKEVLVCVSSSTLITPKGDYGMLRLWIDAVRRAGVKNYFVIAIDNQVAEIMRQLKVPYWRRDPPGIADNMLSSHSISAMKYQMIKEVLELGYSVLLSDVDVVTLKNPFLSLQRDSDIEAMSDGFDPATAYGYDDVFDDPQMGWSRWAHSFKIFSLNSGLFYTRSNDRTIALMSNIAAKLSKEKLWDQAVFNEMVFKPSSPGYQGSNVSCRIMDIYQFTNSKILFKTMRYDPMDSYASPVMIHVNYHSDKFRRMQAIWKRYVEGKVHALDDFQLSSAM